MHDRIRETVDHLAAVGPVTGACRAIGAEQHTSIVDASADGAVGV